MKIYEVISPHYALVKSDSFYNAVLSYLEEVGEPVDFSYPINPVNKDYAESALEASLLDGEIAPREKINGFLESDSTSVWLVEEILFVPENGEMLV